MGLHANLAPSAAERWISCPASVRMAGKVTQEVESVYAGEGTKAHELGEIEVSLAFGLITKLQHTRRYNKWVSLAALEDEQLLDMKRHIAAYVALIEERRALYSNSQILVEQRLPSGIEGCWGTSDAVIVSPEHVEIIDLKYGQGIPVRAEGNPQLRLYGLGALDTYGDVLGETKVVRLTVFQPRLGSTSTEELTADELRAWREEVIPIAAEALTDDAHFGPSEEACRWCPAAGECRARTEFMTQRDFGGANLMELVEAGDADLLAPVELGAILKNIPGIRNWCTAVEDTALRKAYSEQTPIPGWKVVLSGGRRSVPAEDQAAAIQTLIDHGYDAEHVAKFSLKPLGALEKLIGRERLPQLLGRMLRKSPGTPAIVPESDKRPAVDPNGEAAKEFSE